MELKDVFRVLIAVFLMSLASASLIPNAESYHVIENVLGENEAESIIDNNEASSLINGLDLSSNKIDSFLKEEADNFINLKIPVIVHINERLSSTQRSELLNLGVIKYEYSLIKAVALFLNTESLDELADLAFVEKIEFDAPTKVVLAQSTTQTGVSRVWIQHGIEGEGIKIAVLDTGIDNEHQDLKNVVLEKDFTGEGTDDNNGHGTHVASIAAGSGAISGGSNKGVAPKASLMDIKVLNRLGQGAMSDTIAGIQYAVINNADIISMSLGADIPCNGLDATSLASDAAVKQGVHVIVAAGNTGPLPGTIGSPGCAKEVVTVGAVDRLDNIAAFSSRGPTLDGRTKPDIVAPGVLILAAQSGGTYTAKSGTSMSTPHVSGVVALILSENPDLKPEQIKDVLKKTALDLGENANAQGAGRVNAYDAFIEGTGLEPKEPQELPANEDEKDKEEAKKEAREEENVSHVRKVREKEEDGKEYYVVDGTRENNNGEEERVWVWYNKDTKEIDKVEIISFIREVWLSFIDFLDEIFNREFKV